MCCMSLLTWRGIDGRGGGGEDNCGCGEDIVNACCSGGVDDDDKLFDSDSGCTAGTCRSCGISVSEGLVGGFDVALSSAKTVVSCGNVAFVSCESGMLTTV